MMKKVSYHDIAKRKSSVQENHRMNESTNEIFYQAARNCSKTRFKEFVINCSFSPDLASNYITEMISYIKENPDKEIVKHINDNIVPLLNAAALIEAKKVEEFKEAATTMERCDRILANTEKIIKESKIDDIFKRARGLDTDMLMYKVCESVSGFDVVSRGKVVIAIETFCYLAQKNGLEYNENSIIESAAEYFLIKEDTMNIEKLDATLRKNTVADYDPNFSKSEFECIELFKVSPIKNGDLLVSVVNQLMTVPLSKFEVAMRDLFWLIRTIIYASKDELLIQDVVQKIIPSLYYRLQEFHSDKPEYKDYIKILMKFTESVDNPFMYDFNDDISRRVIRYQGAVEKLYLKLVELDDMVYDTYNNYSIAQRGDFAPYVEAGVISKDDIENAKLKLSLLKKKVFKKENLCTVIKNVDRAIAAKFKKIHDNTKANFKRFREKIFALESAEDFITDEGQFDYTVSSFVLQDKVIDSEIQQLASDICKDINNTELANSGLHCYYSSTENILEFHIASDCLYDIKDIELTESFVDDDLYYASVITNIAESFDFEIPTIEQIAEFACNHPSGEYHIALVELCELSGIDSTIVENINILSETCRDFDKEVDNKYNSYKPNMVSFEVATEALRLLSEMVLSEATPAKKPIPKTVPIKKPVVNSKPVATTPKKGESKGFSFNNLELTLMGLKKKAKDLGSKEQALSRNVDNTFRMFMRNLNKALISDRREAIIKGSVIPSFSKCIKIGILLAGLGWATANPAIPCIIALGGLAVSKRLTSKERTLLLDDITVELQIIDKEIQMAESKDQIKKLRQLLKTKKELQRQYQRIRYNSRIGKDLLPSNAGLSSND